MTERKRRRGMKYTPRLLDHSFCRVAQEVLGNRVDRGGEVECKEERER